MRSFGRSRRTWVRAALAGAAAIVATLAATALYLRADKRAVFAEVAGELGAARIVESVERDASAARRVELANHRGETVGTVWIRRPRALAPDYRIVLVYSGEETGRRILDLIPERDDLVLAAPQYAYRKPRGWWRKLRLPYDVRRAAFRAVATGTLTVSHLVRDEGLEPHRILAVGASLGSTFATIHAALDARVPRLLVVHGGGDLPLIVRSIEERRGRPWRGRLAAALAFVLVDTFDPLHFVGEIAPRELVVIGARDDHQFPAASTQALFDRAGEPKRLRWTSGGHVRSAKNQDLEQVLIEIERLLAETAG